jgi:hypothetical protein
MIAKYGDRFEEHRKRMEPKKRNEPTKKKKRKKLRSKEKASLDLALKALKDLFLDDTERSKSPSPSITSEESSGLGTELVRRGKCYICGVPTHTCEECPWFPGENKSPHPEEQTKEKEEEKDEEEQKQGSGSQIVKRCIRTCFRCKSNDHFQDTCTWIQGTRRKEEGPKKPEMMVKILTDEAEEWKGHGIPVRHTKQRKKAKEKAENKEDRNKSQDF